MSSSGDGRALLSLVCYSSVLTTQCTQPKAAACQCTAAPGSGHSCGHTGTSKQAACRAQHSSFPQTRSPPPLGFLWVSFVPCQPLSTATLATAPAAAGVSCSGSYSRTNTLSSARGCPGTPTYTGLGRFPCPQVCSCHVTAPLSPCGRVTCPPQIPMQTCTGHIHSTCSLMQVRVFD